MNERTLDQSSVNGEGHPSPARILVLEDNSSMASLMQLLLEDQGYEVLVSEAGRHIFGLVAEFEPHLITIDILLPDVDGLHIFRQLRAQPETRDIPVVFITALEDRLEEGMALGAQGFLAKPFVGAELNDVIQKALKREAVTECSEQLDAPQSSSGR